MSECLYCSIGVHLNNIAKRVLVVVVLFCAYSLSSTSRSLLEYLLLLLLLCYYCILLCCLLFGTTQYAHNVYNYMCGEQQAAN